MASVTRLILPNANGANEHGADEVPQSAQYGRGQSTPSQFWSTKAACDMGTPASVVPFVPATRYAGLNHYSPLKTLGPFLFAWYAALAKFVPF